MKVIGTNLLLLTCLSRVDVKGEATTVEQSRTKGIAELQVGKRRA